MKTFEEAIDTFRCANVTEEECIGKWGDLVALITQHDDTKTYVAAYAMENDPIVSEWVRADLLAAKQRGDGSSMAARVLTLMCKVMAQGVCIGIEMEKR